MDDSLRLCIEYPIEFPICLLWSVGIDDSESIHHTVDMRIDADIGHIIEDGEDDFGGFDADTWERLDQFQIIRDFSLIFSCEYRASLFDKPRFVPEEVHILEVFLDILERYIDDVTRLSNKAKKWWRNPVDLLVGCLS